MKTALKHKFRKQHVLELSKLLDSILYEFIFIRDRRANYVRQQGWQTRVSLAIQLNPSAQDQGLQSFTVLQSKL